MKKHHRIRTYHRRFSQDAGRQGICHVSQIVPAVLADFCFRLQASHTNHQQAADDFIRQVVIEKTPTHEGLTQ